MKEAKFEELKGKTIDSFDNLRVGSDNVRINCSDDSEFSMRYYDDCCASCSIEEIHGDINDLLDSPILLAEEIVSSENPPDANPKTIEYQESFTWTFYKLSTIKGSVTLRWYGSSNGYYSESVTFEKVD